MTITINDVTIELTVEEAMQILSTDETTVDTYGYTVPQYDGSSIGLKFITTHNGYKIYQSGDYCRWWSSEDYNSKSALEDLDTVKKEIDDHVIRELLKD